MARRVLMFAIVALVVFFLWGLATQAGLQRRQDAFIGRLQQGQSVTDVRRIAFAMGIPIGGVEGASANTLTAEVGQTWRLFTPCSDAYYVRLTFESDKLAAWSEYDGQVCM